jgi:hypothetical protein
MEITLCPEAIKAELRWDYHRASARMVRAFLYFTLARDNNHVSAWWYVSDSGALAENERLLN